MHRAHLITWLALASLGIALGCSGAGQTAKTQAAAAAGIAAPQAADSSESNLADAPEDSGNAPEPTQVSAGETVPIAPTEGAVASTADGEWAHADTPAELPDSVTPEEGRAPDFKVTTLDGKVLDSAILYGSKPVSITIWATWCPPCLKEIPTIQKLYNEHGDEVQFVAISIDDPRQLKEVEKMVASRNMTYPVGIDVKREIGRAFQAEGIPLTVFVDKQGAEVGREEGYGGEESLIQAFEEAFFKGGAAPSKRTGTSV